MTEMRELWRYLLLSLGEVLAVVLVYGVIFHEHFLTVWREEGAAWIFLAVILVALGNYLFFKRQAKRRLASQALLLKKLSELVENQPSRHVLLPKDDEYYQLSRLVNRLQSNQRSLLRSYQQQNRDYLTLLQSLTSGVIVFDQRKETVLYNHVLTSILNTTELKRQPFYQVFTAVELIAATQKVYQNKEDQRLLWQKKVAQGNEWFEVQVVYVPLSRHHYSVMCIFNDVTEIKLLEIKQREFMANASHELKTPLTAIQGFSETLLAGALDDKKTARDFVQIIFEQSQQLTELIEDISALAHNKKTQELKLEQIKLKTFCKRILTSYLAQSKAKNLAIELQIPDGFEINCDIKYLQNIISNLIQNAIRYNVVDGMIKIIATSSANEWCLTVYNTGQTLTQADKERIYERFYRADKARFAEGSGLGLAIVKEAVEALSGQIVVMSPYKNGTKFMVTLPLFLT